MFSLPIVLAARIDIGTRKTQGNTHVQLAFPGCQVERQGLERIPLGEGCACFDQVERDIHVLLEQQAELRLWNHLQIHSKHQS